MWQARLTKSLKQSGSNLNTPFFWTLLVSQHQNTPIYYIRCGNDTQQSDNDKTCFHLLHLFFPPPTESCLLTLDRCLLTIDRWPLTVACWPLTIDRWLLTVDYWPLTIDYWPLTVDRWPFERKWKKYVTEYLSVMKQVVLLHADYYHDEPQKGSDSLWKGVSSIGLERCPKRKQGDKL